MKKITLFCCLFFLQFTMLESQELYVFPPLPPDGYTEAGFIVETFLNSAVVDQFTLQNVSRTCYDEGFGIFAIYPSSSGGDGIFNLEEGIVLSTGHISDIPGPSTELISTSNSTSGDNDLTDWSGVSTNDACVFEFDVTTFGNSFTFNYVFGSEEYDEYVCSNYNDVFALLISGPNPAGGMYENDNIALIPDTDLPIAINTVNDGNSDVSGPTASDTCYLNYSNYYAGISPMLGFEGLTVTLQASVDVIPFETYHFKIGIADGTDNIYDSAVFLGGGSFEPKPAIVVNQSGGYAEFLTNEEGNYIPLFQNEDGTSNPVMIEGCQNKSIEFNLGEVAEICTLHVEISGTAENGVDYTDLGGNPFPSEIVFIPGESGKTIELMGVSDGLYEGIEYIALRLVGIDGHITDNEDFIIRLDTIFLGDHTTDLITVFPLPGQTITEGAEVSVAALGANYLNWFPPEDFTQVDTSFTTLTYNPENTYGCVVINQGCADTLFLELTPTPIDSTVNDTTTGWLDQSLPNISLFPNPVQNFLNIAGAESQVINTTIFNQNGTRVLETKQQKINFSSFQTGLYFIAIEIGGQVYYERIIKN